MPESSVPTDNELVAESLRERSSFGNLVERYEARLTRYISRLGVLDPDDRADVLQDIFIKVYRNLNSFDQNLSFSTWIYRIAHNEAVSWYRKLKARPEGYLVAEGDDIVKLVATDSADIEAIFDQNVNKGLLLQALEQLDHKYREVLILRYFEHLEYEDISDILQVPTGTVGTWVARAKKQLKQKLEPLVEHI